MAAGRMEDVNVPLIVTIGLVSMLLLVVIVVGATAWYRYEYALERQRKVYEAEHHEVERLTRQQRERIETVQWADEDRTRATIPIDEAMELTIEQYRNE